TQGDRGMTLVTGTRVEHFPALSKEIYDVSGAGDTVIATLATALAWGAHFYDAVRLSNFAASIVVSRVGTVPVDWATLYALATEAGGKAIAPRRPASMESENSVARS